MSLAATQSTAVALLARVHKLGAELIPTNTPVVRIYPPTPLPDELLAELRENKDAIVDYLNQFCFYRFRLRGGRRGIYRTETRCLVRARAELAKVYGERLVVVAGIGLGGGRRGDVA